MVKDHISQWVPLEHLLELSTNKMYIRGAQLPPYVHVWIDNSDRPISIDGTIGFPFRISGPELTMGRYSGMLVHIVNGEVSFACPSHRFESDLEFFGIRDHWDKIVAFLTENYELLSSYWIREISKQELEYALQTEGL